MPVYIKTPLNYMGSKFNILHDIIPVFPEDINTFVDLFGGGFNVGINVEAETIVYNDIIWQLMKLYEHWYTNPLDMVTQEIETVIEAYGLSLTNEAGYYALREDYNNGEYDPAMLFALSAHSFSYQLRFNSSGQFNMPFGKNQSHFNESMKYNLYRFIDRLKSKNVIFMSRSFEEVALDDFLFKQGDFIYCDPPYINSTAPYNDGSRLFEAWGEKSEKILLDFLVSIDDKGVKWGLSNNLLTNPSLEDWALRNGFYIREIENSYSNSSYQKVQTGKDREVLIINYKPTHMPKQLGFADL